MTEIKSSDDQENSKDVSNVASSAFSAIQGAQVLTRDITKVDEMAVLRWRLSPLSKKSNIAPPEPEFLLFALGPCRLVRFDRELQLSFGSSLRFALRWGSSQPKTATILE